MSKTTLLRKYKIRRLSLLTNGAHMPSDPDSEDCGAWMVIKKGKAIDIDENTLLKGINDEIKLEDGEFDVQEITKEDVEYELLFKIGLDEKEDAFRYSIRDPRQFDRVWDITPKKTGGVKFITVTKGKEGSKVQAVIFDKSKYDANSAKTWIKEHINDLKKGEDIETMELQEILKEFEGKLDEKLTSINEKLEKYDERLLKMETPPEESAPANGKPDEKTQELEKSLKENHETQMKAFEELKKGNEELKKSNDEFSARLKTIEELPLGNPDENPSGFIGALQKGGKDIKTESGYNIVKSEDGKIKFTKGNTGPREIVLKIDTDQLKQIREGGS